MRVYYKSLKQNMESLDKHSRVLHFPSEIPEYKDIEEKYYEEEKALSQYREDCKNEALELFSKWFYSLWD